MHCEIFISRGRATKRRSAIPEPLATMKFLPVLFALIVPLTTWAEENRSIILDENVVKNLQIETATVEEKVFEESIFALGRIEEIPENHGVLSSRIPGRVVRVEARVGDTVVAGQTLVRVESRQPGDPPPVVELKAPIGGLIIDSHVGLGEPVEPEKELLDISDLSEVLAIARVPEHLAAQLAPGTKAHINVPALGEARLSGEMLRFGTVADRAAGTIDAVFKIPNPGLRMRPNMRAEFSIVIASTPQAVTIPRAALQGDAAQRFVYVKNFDLPNAFDKVPVRPGRGNDREIEILAGLFPGDEVVTNGAYSLSFAGTSSMSLKEALDAAHGHEHNEDGSEIDAAHPPAKQAEQNATPHVHEGEKRESPLWRYATFALGLLLIASLAGHFFRRGEASEISNPEGH